jgi:hypothetical protein
MKIWKGTEGSNLGPFKEKLGKLGLTNEENEAEKIFIHLILFAEHFFCQKSRLVTTLHMKL